MGNCLAIKRREDIRVPPMPYDFYIYYCEYCDKKIINKRRCYLCSRKY